MAFPTDLTAAVDGVTEIVAAHLNNLEAKLGVDSSAVVTSLDYLLKNPLSEDPGHTHTLSAIPSITVTAAEINHLSGVTADVQGQVDGKVDISGDTMTGDLSVAADGAISVEAETTDDVAASKASLAAVATDVRVDVYASPANATGSILGVSRANRGIIAASGSALSSLRIGTVGATANLVFATDSTARMTIAATGIITAGELTIDPVSELVRIGNATGWSSECALDVAKNEMTAGLCTALNVQGTFNMTTTGSYDVRGLRNILVINNGDGDYSANSLIGGTCYAFLNHAYVSSAMTEISHFYGVYTDIGLYHATRSVTGQITSLVAYYAALMTGAVGGVIENAYGYRIGSSGDGTITNLYCFYVGTIVDATDVWGLYFSSSVTKNRIFGNVGFGTGTFGTDLDNGLVIAAGTAPSAGVTDATQMWTADRDGNAVTNGLNIRSESGVSYIFSDRVGLGTLAPTDFCHVYHATDDVRIRIETDKANGIAALRYTNDARTYSTRISSLDVFEIRDVTENLARVRVDTYGNVIIGEVVCGTSAVRNFIIGNGDAPSDSPANAVALWSANRGGTDTKAGLHIRSEDGTSHVFSDRVGLGTILPTIMCDVSGKIGFATDGSTYWCVVVSMTAGENITQGQILICSTAANDTALIAGADSDMPIGVALAAATTGNPVWVAVSGVALVQFKAGVTPTRGYIAYMSDSAGAADNSAALPAVTQHNREIGHVMYTGSSGGLARCVLHFN